MLRRFVLGVLLLLLTTGGVAGSPALAAPSLSALDPAGTAVTSAASTTSASPAPGGTPHVMLNQQAAAQLAPTAPSNVTYHGGPTMHSPTVYLIYWLPTGLHYEPAGTATSDSTFESLVKGYLTNLNSSPLYELLTQYTDPPPLTAPSLARTVVSGPVLNSPLGSLTIGGTWVDTKAYGHSGSTSDPLHDADIRTEVARAMSQNNWVQGPNTEFFVYTALDINSCQDASNTSCSFPVPTSSNWYCAYHSYYPTIDFGTPGSGNVIYTNMGDTQSGCTISGATPHNDARADSEINMTSHEFFESVSDPLLNAWFDGSTSGEIGDLCNWHFGARDPLGADVMLNPTSTGFYIVQQEWSNTNSGCELQLPPTITSISPNKGPASGGGTVNTV